MEEKIKNEVITPCEKAISLLWLNRLCLKKPAIEARFTFGQLLDKTTQQTYLLSAHDTWLIRTISLSGPNSESGLNQNKKSHRAFTYIRIMAMISRYCTTTLGSKSLYMAHFQKINPNRCIERRAPPASFACPRWLS